MEKEIDFNISFKPLEESDFNLVHRWFNKSHVQAFYSLRQWTIEEVCKKLAPYVQGEKHMKSFIIYLENLAIGYIQLYPIREHPWDNQDLSEEIVQNAAGFDLFIGEEEFLGKGLGCHIIDSFLDEYIWPKYKYCLADPDVRNKSSIRLFENCGFTKHNQIDSTSPIGEKVRLQLFFKKNE